MTASRRQVFRGTAGSSSRALDDWPAPLRVSPHLLLLVVASAVALAWIVFIAVDILNVAGLGERLELPMWSHLFNDRPVEWSQWFLLAGAIVGAGYIAGRMHGTEHHGAAVFFLLLGAGLGLMLIEEAGDIRHEISWYVQDSFGREPLFGIHYKVLSDGPYFAALAALPLYAVLRYGRFAFRGPTVRPYLIAAVVLYAIAALAAALLQTEYEHIGAFLDRTLFGERFPTIPGMSMGNAYYYFIDAALEETVETFAAACMLAVVLAYIADLRAGRIR